MLDVVAGVTCWLVTMAILFVCAVEQPDAASCPKGWWLAHGVRADGEFLCRPIGPNHEVRTRRGGWTDDSEQPPGELHGRVYCKSRAFTDDGMRVRCE